MYQRSHSGAILGLMSVMVTTAGSTGVATAATLRMNWVGAGGNTIEMSPGDTADIQIWVDLIADESLSTVSFANETAPGVEQIATAVSPPGWGDGSVHHVLGAIGQQVAFSAALPSDSLYGQGSYLIGTQTVRLNAGSHDDMISIAVDHDAPSLLVVNETGQFFVWDATQHTTNPGFIAYGDWGNPGWGTPPVGQDPNPLYINVHKFIFWLEDAADGDNVVNVPLNGTGVIQLWMDYTAGPSETVRYVGGDAGLDHTFGPDFEVVGFGGPGPADEYGPWGESPRPLYTAHRGFLDQAPFNGVPDTTGPGNLNDYMHTHTVTPPYDGDCGLLPNLGPILLDEIIIEGTSLSVAPNEVTFATGEQAPAGFEITSNGASWDVDEIDISLGVGASGNPLLVNVIIDCNTNGVSDDLDIAEGTSEDCNTNAIPDECDITGGTSSDCQPDGFPDECQVAGGPFPLFFTDPAPLNNNAATDSGYDRDPQVTTDGAGNWVAVWYSYDDLGGTIGIDKDILVARSVDNGATWTDPAPLNNNAASDVGDDYDPQVTTDGAGNWVAVWWSYDDLGETIGTDADILVACSVDNGATWTYPAPLNNNATTDSGDNLIPQVTTDGAGNWVAVWYSYDDLGETIGTDPDILVARSVDNGATWTDPAPLNNNAATDSGNDWEIQVTTDGAGNWVAVWGSNDDLGLGLGIDGDVLVARSVDNGVTWTDPEPLNNNAATDSELDWFPQVSTDGAGNWVAVWASYDDLGGAIGPDDDILVARSTDNGVTWTDPEPLNNNAATDSGNDFDPQVTTDGAGNWVAVWYSYDDLGGTIGTDADILVARSVDNGATWTDPAPLNNNAATDSGDNHPQVTTDGAGNWAAVWDSYDDLGSGLGTDADILVARIDGVPPSPDCNTNGIPDECDIAGGTSADCNTNGVPDECDLAGGTSGDCNINDVPDECELDANDCNTNGVPDECDLDGNDINTNGIPDECEILGACCWDGVCAIEADTDCLAGGGEFWGEGTVCSPNPCPAACCRIDGTCEDVPSADCGPTGGQWQEGMDCASYACPPGVAARRYEVVYLDDPAGHQGMAFSINNLGQAVGYIAPCLACLFDTSGQGDITLLGGYPGPGGSPSGEAWGIGDAGEIVGYSINSNGHHRAILFDKTGGGTNIDLGTLADTSDAHAINAAGQIVGVSDGSGGGPTWFRTHQGEDNQLLSESGGVALGINDNGQAVGWYWPYYRQAMLFNLGGGTVVLHPTNGGPWKTSRAQDISNSGLVVGHAQHLYGPGSRAFLFDETGSGGGEPIGPVYSVAYAVNDHGVAVGVFWSGGPPDYAALFDLEGGWIKLQDLIHPASYPNDLYNANDINNDGWIVGGTPAWLLKPIILGDIDDDCDVDLDDHVSFVDCLAGPGATPSPTPPTTVMDCRNYFDFDADYDVDLADFAEFQEAFTGPIIDCNSNCIPDDQDIFLGNSEDCNTNGIPDECDIAAGTSEDCQSNGVSDECELVDSDCNSNEIPDECDIASATSADCNTNGIPDECDIAAGTGEDCNTNGILDECDLEHEYRLDDGTSEMSLGCSTNGYTVWLNHFTVEPGRETIAFVAVEFGYVPEGSPATIYLWSDPDGNGDPDDAQVLASEEVVVSPWAFSVAGISPTFVGPAGTSFFVGAIILHADGEVPTRVDTDGPDQGGSWFGCQTTLVESNLTMVFPNPENYMVRATALGGSEDCNTNGVPDECDLAATTSADCDGDGVPDECSGDCNTNGIWDACDVFGGTSADCNTNSIPDECDIAAGTSYDENTNGIPDECDVVIDTVTVGNPGNDGEWSGEGYGGSGQDRICGAVGYEYNIGTFEVTAGQYTAFLNAVAATDTYGLYKANMDSSQYGCQITQNGTDGSYTYDFSGRPSGTEADWADRPVNYVSWGDAARFANWLHNGQPTGAQDLSTTEDGSYFLDGALSDAELLAITREPDATWVIPSEDEWYKAAYHYNDGMMGNYWDYPTESDTVPSLEAPPGTDMTDGSANYYDGAFAIGSPYFRTEVGAYDAKPSDSAYGTFDQGGNVFEWNETIVAGLYRGSRGGSFGSYDPDLHAAYRDTTAVTTFESDALGFRVAEVP